MADLNTILTKTRHKALLATPATLSKISIANEDRPYRSSSAISVSVVRIEDQHPNKIIVPTCEISEEHINSKLEKLQTELVKGTKGEQ